MQLYEYRDNARGQWRLLPRWEWGLHHILGRPYRRDTLVWDAPVVARGQRESITSADATLPFDPTRRPSIGCRVYPEAEFRKEGKDAPSRTDPNDEHL